MATDPTGEYEETLTVNADAATVFDFVADIRNMPKYLPTTTAAQPQGEERVRVQGEANGKSYDSDGYLRPDRAAKRLEWGADEGYYSGWMQVSEAGAASSVTIHISLRDSFDGAPAPEQVLEGLRAGLESIRNHVEGSGGKVESSAAT